MVLAPSSQHLQGLKHLIDDRGDGKGHPVLPAGRKRYPQILVVQFYPKAGIEGMPEHLLLVARTDLGRGAPRQPIARIRDDDASIILIAVGKAAS